MPGSSLLPIPLEASLRKKRIEIGREEEGERGGWIGKERNELETWRPISRGEARAMHVILCRSCGLIYMHDYITK